MMPIPFSHIQFFATLWTVACQAPLSMEFSKQEYQSGQPFPSPGDLPDPRIEPGSPALQAHSLPSQPPVNICVKCQLHQGSLSIINPANNLGRCKALLTSDLGFLNFILSNKFSRNNPIAYSPLMEILFCQQSQLIIESVLLLPILSPDLVKMHT